MSTTFSTFSSAAAARPASVDPADVRLAACDTVVCVVDFGMSCLEVGAVDLVVAELIAAVKIYLAEVSPHRLHGDATSRDTS